MLMIQKPVSATLYRRIVRRNTGRGEADERLPGAVDVVDAPTAEPGAVALLGAAEELDAAADGGIVRFLFPHGKSFEGTAGEIGRAGVDHGVVIGEWNPAEEFSVVIAIERAPAAITIL